MTVIKRHVLNKLQLLLEMFPCVAVIGARQVGKSTLVKMASNDSWQYFDLEKADDFQLISSDPIGFFKRKSNQIIIDEVQQYPEIFKTLRSVIDEERDSVGRFILTWSSSPEIIKGLTESLAGRIATIELSPFLSST